MLLATIIIFIASTESQLRDRIKSPSTYLMASVIFKILKAITTIMVFSLNGNNNDYFVAFFFFSTSLNGIIYLKICGYQMPLKVLKSPLE